MNRTYELMFIVRPDMVDEDLNKLISTLEASVTSAHGTMKSEVWGKRRLAYSVRRFNDGIFVLLLLEGTGAMRQGGRAIGGNPMFLVPCHFAKGARKTLWQKNWIVAEPEAATLMVAAAPPPTAITPS